MQHILENQPDFLAQKGMIQEVIEERGHKVIFYPKFHPELNFIEMYWGASKKYSRKNCDYTWTGLQRIVPIALNQVPLSHLRAFARKSYRYIDVYRKGLDIKQAEYSQTSIYRTRGSRTKVRYIVDVRYVNLFTYRTPISLQ